MTPLVLSGPSPASPDDLACILLLTEDEKLSKREHLQTPCRAVSIP